MICLLGPPGLQKTEFKPPKKGHPRLAKGIYLFLFALLGFLIFVTFTGGTFNGAMPAPGDFVRWFPCLPPQSLFPPFFIFLLVGGGVVVIISTFGLLGVGLPKNSTLGKLLRLLRLPLAIIAWTIISGLTTIVWIGSLFASPSSKPPLPAPSPLQLIPYLVLAPLTFCSLLIIITLSLRLAFPKEGEPDMAPAGALLICALVYVLNLSTADFFAWWIMLLMAWGVIYFSLPSRNFIQVIEGSVKGSIIGAVTSASEGPGRGMESSEEVLREIHHPKAVPRIIPKKYLIAIAGLSAVTATVGFLSWHVLLPILAYVFYKGIKASTEAGEALVRFEQAEKPLEGEEDKEWEKWKERW